MVFYLILTIKEYFAPLSNPKTKHLNMKNTIDFIRIDEWKLGAINFNNMIPVKKENYEIINLNEKCNSKEEQSYQELLLNQYTWLNINMQLIKNKASNLYRLYTQNRLADNIKNRCCNYSLLEKNVIYTKTKQ